MKNSVLTVTLLGLISFGASAAKYNHHDDNASDRYANELRLKAFEGETSYPVKVNPWLSLDRDEPVSTQYATELRKQALNKPVRDNVESFARRDRDEPVSTEYATELRKQALGEPVRDDLESFVQRDRDEPVSTEYATELRKQALDNV